MYTICQSYLQQCDAREKRYAAVIVEPRRHPLMHSVVKNVSSVLGRQWQIYIFTHDVQFVSDLDATVIHIDSDSLDATSYSLLLMSVGFWEQVSQEVVLIFQTDSFMFENSHQHINDFTKHCFIGGIYYYCQHTEGDQTPCLSHCGMQPHLSQITQMPKAGFAMCGGFSIRHRSAMLRCIREVSQRDAMRYRQSHGLIWPFPDMSFCEDAFFTHALEILGYAMPSQKEASDFCFNNPHQPSNDPLSMHHSNKDWWDDDCNTHMHSFVQTLCAL